MTNELTTAKSGTPITNDGGSGIPSLIVRAGRNAETRQLENPEAKLEHAQQMAAHSDPKTTRLYDRSKASNAARGPCSRVTPDRAKSRGK